MGSFEQHAKLEPPVSRRRFLALIAVTGGATIAGCRSASRAGNQQDTTVVSPAASTSPTVASSFPVTVTTAGAPPISPSTAPAFGGFVEPAVLASAAGILDVELECRAVMVPFEGGSRWALAYNGSVPGPTWRVRPGDKVRVRLVNRLEEPTNLHTHGLHVSPSDPADNPFVMIEAGGEHRYEFDIPADHPAGTFWYHPHHHGRVAAQVSGGLAGMIVVDDGHTPPLLQGATERVMVLSDPRLGADSSVLDLRPGETMFGRFGDRPLVNGQAEPTLSTTAGTVERWRLVNASASRYYRLRLDGLEWRQIATDGGQLNEATQIDTLTLTPGERVELAVAPAGTQATLSVDTIATSMMGGGMMGGQGTNGIPTSSDTLVHITVTGTAPAANIDGTLAAVERLADATVDGSRSFVLSMAMMGMRPNADSFTINGAAFDPERTDVTAAIDTIEDWTIRNASMMSHPFHLHAWPFQVIDRSDRSDAPLGWKDTVDIPAGGWVRIRIRFADFTGRTVYHCHILDHEDLGMMGIIEVR